jgi:type VI secretion system protein ImpB
MARESVQHKIGRVRTPRVRITYDVETGGALEKKEIPFVVGVLADLSGDSEKPLPRIDQRNFEEIDRDNIDQIIAKHKPRLVMRVPNKLTKGEKDPGLLNIELKFGKLADFHPENVARQVEPLRQLLELRTKLSNLQITMSGNDKLEHLLRAAVDETERNRSRTQANDRRGN